MVGLLPPSVKHEPHTVDKFVTSSVIDLNQIMGMRHSLSKQFFTVNTLPTLQLLLDSLEFT